MGSFPLLREVTFFKRRILLVCDGECHKAWGINKRPKAQLSEDVDDYEYYGDAELGTAPIDPGTSEGECKKPRESSERLNKWCARECERSEIFEVDDFVVIRGGFTTRIRNNPHYV